MRCVLILKVVMAIVYSTPSSQRHACIQGIALAQQNKFVDAVNLLEPLFEAIEPMQETVAVRICLLLMELYLSLNSFAQAASKPAVNLN